MGGNELVWDFEVEETGNYVLAGVVHHNSGKSVSTAVEFARRILGYPLYDSQGKVIPSKWPVPNKDHPRIYWVIGWDTSHIGQTIHKLLFQPGMGGQFRCIKDLHTGEWRTWNRANPEDVKRSKESMLTEPLIPERYIESWDWESLAAKQFSGVRLKNGAVIYAYPSSARNPKQGDAVSGIWIDEDIQYPGHLREWQDRLTDEQGWFLWSVWPHVKNEALLGLIDRAEFDAYSTDPKIKSFQLIMTDNPYLASEGKEQALARMGSDEEIARRNRGELLINSLNMYNFDSDIHLIRRPATHRLNRKRTKVYDNLVDMWVKYQKFPKEWTRYLTIDPSHSRTAVHSWVVPPREYEGDFYGEMAISEWELVARRASAKDLATALEAKMAGLNYEAFIMDMQMGRQTQAGREIGDNACEVYSRAFRERKLFSRLTNYSFAPGCPTPSTVFRAVRDLMVVNPITELPTLMLVEDTNPETIDEFKRYQKKRENRGEGMDSVMDVPANPRLFDCMASVQYFSAYIQQAFAMDTAYVDPSNYAPKGSAAYQRAQAILKKDREKTGNVVYLGAGDYDKSGF